MTDSSERGIPDFLFKLFFYPIIALFGLGLLGAIGVIIATAYINSKPYIYDVKAKYTNATDGNRVRLIEELDRNITSEQERYDRAKENILNSDKKEKMGVIDSFRVDPDQKFPHDRERIVLAIQQYILDTKKYPESFRELLDETELNGEILLEPDKYVIESNEDGWLLMRVESDFIVAKGN